MQIKSVELNVCLHCKAGVVSSGVKSNCMLQKTNNLIMMK